MLKDKFISLKKIPLIFSDSDMIIVGKEKIVPLKSTVVDSDENTGYKPEDVVYTSRFAGKDAGIGEADKLIKEHEIFAKEEGEKLVAGNNYCLILCTEVERDNHKILKSGLINPEWEEIQNYTQMGTVTSVGKNVEFVKKGDELIFFHQVQNTPERKIKQDNFGNQIWAVNSVGDFASEILGVRREGIIIPLNNKVLAKAYDIHSNNLIEQELLVMVNHDERHIPFRVRALNVCPDSAYKKDEILVCEAASNYEVIIDKEPYWFINEDNIMYPDDEQQIEFIEHDFETKQGRKQHRIFLAKV